MRMAAAHRPAPEPVPARVTPGTVERPTDGGVEEVRPR